MSKKVVRPEDTVPDDANYAQFEGGQVRKGTFAAIILNAELLDDPAASSNDKAAALAMIESLMPNIVLFGAHKHLQWKNPQVQQIMEEIQRNK